ncbi:MAG TPA: hypothetical protein VID94_00480, partial [Acidimicrobiales bacterium]
MREEVATVAPTLTAAPPATREVGAEGPWTRSRCYESGLRPSRILLAALLVTGAAACSADDDEAAPAATTSAPVPEAGEPLTVGDLDLTPCEDLEDIWCGTIEVPQDREDDSSDETLTVGFEWYPRSDPGPADGLLVAMEGGPGYATTASRDYYTELYEPVRDHRDLLLMDLRGTGRS